VNCLARSVRLGTVQRKDGNLARDFSTAQSKPSCC